MVHSPAKKQSRIAPFFTFFCMTTVFELIDGREGEISSISQGKYLVDMSICQIPPEHK